MGKTFSKKWANAFIIFVGNTLLMANVETIFPKKIKRYEVIKIILSGKANN